MRTSRILVLGLLASAALTAHAQPGREPPERWQRMTPEQREQIWRGLPPDQKLELWRRLPPAERQVLRERMTPEQREAMRERWLEERARRVGDGGSLRRLTAEERHHLREQVREANREWRARGRADDER